LPKKGHVGWFFRKTPEIRIKHDQMLKEKLFLQIFSAQRPVEKLSSDIL
jgi:hypothetical protein